MIGEAELLQRLRNREKNSIDEANDYEIKKENITFSKDEISVLFEEARKGMSS